MVGASLSEETRDRRRCKPLQETTHRIGSVTCQVCEENTYYINSA